MAIFIMQNVVIYIIHLLVYYLFKIIEIILISLEELIEEKTRKVNRYNLEVDYDDYKGEITLDSDAFDTDYKLNCTVRFIDHYFGSYFTVEYITITNEDRDTLNNE